MVVDIEHPIGGTQTVAGPILEMSATPAAARGPSPTTGQHTREVLAELGFAEGEVTALLGQGSWRRGRDEGERTASAARLDGRGSRVCTSPGRVA